MHPPSTIPALAPLSLALFGLASFQASAKGPSSQDLPETAHSISTRWGVVQQPTLPRQVCATLKAALVPVAGSLDALDQDPSQSRRDTARLQAAIDDCPAGSAVHLVPGDAGQSGVLSGPLTLKSGVTLWLDRNVTLFASRNPQDYDNGLGTCGTATNDKAKSCNPLIHVTGAAGSGIVGAGKIDGRGGSTLTAGPNAGKASWWDLAYLNVSKGLSQHVPRLLQIDNSTDVTLYDITLENSPNFHVISDNVVGLTAWGIKILAPSLVYSRPGYHCPAGSTPDVNPHATCFTPETAKNTDGFDPGQSKNVLLAYSYISTGDDGVAIKAAAKASRVIASENMLFAHNQFYYTHGFSLGSETDAGMRHIAVRDLSIDGFNANDVLRDPYAANGLRIKSDASRGGHVDDISFENICMRGVARPLVFDANYANPATRTKLPQFTGISLSNVHSLGSTTLGGGELSFYGYRDASTTLPITISLDNVVLEGGKITFAQPHFGGPASNPGATHFTFNGGPVSFYDQLTSSMPNDVQLQGTPGPGAPLQCNGAFIALHSVLPDSPI
ncbi:glycoside hydrolase family 28 protein [Xanthomonas floridensis]|uniref:Glycoside hydrolase family 28 protein n=1 Tax=Xanthomonas floridensis TaxID=1843580 RepID=A0A1A9M5P5_9XANT|nr:glycoside hydrolase family 28 protein [Xanthomonas floridensis]MEA5124244.1 glycoside hydrolase family 28 protein [Xanthomonas floridensis]MEA5131796.1 glycoside hydrolase family 28 protein [Xanthomonas floridensis]OAG65804.1 polygalacturonase [Xanthomonas floridensis]